MQNAISHTNLNDQDNCVLENLVFWCYFYKAEDEKTCWNLWMQINNKMNVIQWVVKIVVWKCMHPPPSRTYCMWGQNVMFQAILFLTLWPLSHILLHTAHTQTLYYPSMRTEEVCGELLFMEAAMTLKVWTPLE